MKKVKIVTMTVSKPEIFEERINNVIESVENDEKVRGYTVDVSISGETLLGVVKTEIETERGER